MYIFLYLSPLFELFFQVPAKSDREFEVAQYVVFVVFTPLFIQDNTNVRQKALENHMSELCSSQNCQKVFVTHLWLHYAKVRYFILA